MKYQRLIITNCSAPRDLPFGDMEQDAPLKDTLNRSWLDNKSNSFGFKMLAKFGWKEDKGLGKNEDGITNAIKLKKREDGLGLGMTSDGTGNSAWNQTTRSFNGILDELKAAYGGNDDKGKKKKKKKSALEKDDKEKPKKASMVSVGMK